MALTLDGLDPDFRMKLESLLGSLQSSGVEMRPYNGVRTPQEQAIFWRQSRSKEEIAAAIMRLENSGAPYLASVLNDVGPAHGEHVTNSLPGLSWHQWGQAMDCFWAVNGTAEWSATKLYDGINGYRMYAEKAKEVGLDAGGNWKSFKDWPHTQLQTFGSPVSAGFTLAQIDAEMKRRFS